MITVPIAIAIKKIDTGQSELSRHGSSKMGTASAATTLAVGLAMEVKREVAVEI